MIKKILIVFGIIVLLAVGFGIFIKTQQDVWICRDGQWIRKGSPKTNPPHSPCAGKSTTVELPTIPPDSTVVSFYTWLNKTEDVLTNESYKNSPYLTDSYKQKLPQNISSNTEPNYNPFTCTTQNPTSYKITKSTTKQTTAVVLIEQTFPTEKKSIPIELQAKGKNWKINNIKCPQN